MNEKQNLQSCRFRWLFLKYRCFDSGCDQNHEQVDPDALYKSFLLRVRTLLLQFCIFRFFSSLKLRDRTDNKFRRLWRQEAPMFGFRRCYLDEIQGTMEKLRFKCFNFQSLFRSSKERSSITGFDAPRGNVKIMNNDTTTEFPTITLNFLSGQYPNVLNLHLRSRRRVG